MDWLNEEASQRNATQRNATQRNASQGNADHRKATQANARQRDSTHANARQREGAQANATQRKPTRLNARQRDSTQVWKLDPNYQQYYENFDPNQSVYSQLNNIQVSLSRLTSTLVQRLSNLCLSQYDLNQTQNSHIP